MSSIKQTDFSVETGSAKPHSFENDLVGNNGKTLPPDSDYLAVLSDGGAVYSQLAQRLESDQNGDSNFQLDKAVNSLNQYIQNEQRDLEFELIQQANLTVVKVISRETGEVIRQIPEQEVVDLARKLDNKEPLHLFNTLV